MTFQEAKAYILKHSEDLGKLAARGDVLCATIMVLIDLYLEEPENVKLMAILIQAVEELSSTGEWVERVKNSPGEYLN